MHDDVREIIRKTHDFFIRKNLTLSVAESCTGGLICSYLTDIEGASSFFKGGIVCYWAESKIDVLRLSPETITSYGAVSSETALEMAEKVRLLFQSDYSIAATGNLGPTAIEGKEKGIVYIAISKKGQLLCRQLNLTGDRINNKVSSALTALKFIIER